MNILNKVAIIGAGQAGLALACYFSSLGLSVSIFASPDHPGAINHVSNKRGIDSTGLLNGFYKVDTVSTDIKYILENNQVIFIVLPTYAHDQIFSIMLPYLKNEHKIINVTGNFSSLFFEQKIISRNKYRPIIADINLSPFACRLENNILNIIGLKNKLSISALNNENTVTIINIIKDIFPSKIIPCKNPIEVGLNNVNGICHPAILMLNAGRIGDSKEEFYFNRDGVTPEIANVLTSLDQDRLEIGRLLDIRLSPFLEIMDQYYNERYFSIYEFFQKTSVLNAKKLCPNKINCRYIEEDIPYLLVPWLSLARMVNYRALAIESLINIASLLTNKNYMALGRNLEDVFAY